MKTAEQKAEDFIKKLSLGSYRTVLIGGLIELIKEQDCNTRHACADAIAGIFPESFDGEENLIYQHKAYASCINTKTV